jgi:acetyltransferase-like isoleucine patch superfamily enzyme
MKSVAHYRARLQGMDFYDYVNHLLTLVARAKGRLFYSFVFGAFGRRSWLKKPDQIYGASRVFIEDDVRIEKGAVLYAVRKYSGQDYGGRIRIGRGTFLNRYFNASSAVGIDIGEDVAFGSNVFLCDFDHGYSNPDIDRISSPLVTKGPIKIGDRCWLGANVYVASGVTLGDGCVVGANSVVTSSFPANTVLAGVPAKAIRQWNPDCGEWQRVALK